MTPTQRIWHPNSAACYSILFCVLLRARSTRRKSHRRYVNENIYIFGSAREPANLTDRATLPSPKDKTKENEPETTRNLPLVSSTERGANEQVSPKIDRWASASSSPAGPDHRGLRPTLGRASPRRRSAHAPSGETLGSQAGVRGAVGDAVVRDPPRATPTTLLRAVDTRQRGAVANGRRLPNPVSGTAPLALTPFSAANQGPPGLCGIFDPIRAKPAP